MEGGNLEQDVIQKLSERWDRMIYSDNEEYRTTQWEYFGIPMLICYHVATGRFRLFMEGRSNRWDLTTALNGAALAACQRYVESHRNVCDESW